MTENTRDFILCSIAGAVGLLIGCAVVGYILFTQIHTEAQIETEAHND